MSDHRKRSLAKSINYRILATVITSIIAYLFTGKLALALGIGTTEGIAKIIFYYIHERIWNRIKWEKSL